jgi:hypothetical protein
MRSRAKHTFVCFDCQTAYRRLKREAIPVCGKCGKECRRLGWKIKLPPKRDVKAWAQLREDYFKALKEFESAIAVERVRSRHQLERERVRFRNNPQQLRVLDKQRGGSEHWARWEFHRDLGLT